MKHRILILIALVASGSAASYAQVGRDAVERGSNRKQISQGKAAVETDSKELQAFDTHLSTLKAACAQNDAERANRELTALQKLMHTEQRPARSSVRHPLTPPAP